MIDVSPASTRSRVARFVGVLLFAAALGCAEQPGSESAPANTWQATSPSGAFSIETGPRDGSAAIGRFHHWTVRVLDAGGDPVYPARIGISGGMPGHGHGMPSQPQVTEYLGDGRYLIEGMNFNMAGAWVLVFGIEADGRRDRVELELELDI